MLHSAHAYLHAHAYACFLTTRTGEYTNTDVTAPAALMALGLMFIRTNNVAVASRLDLPDTRYLVDFVRSDVLLLRVVARSLIMWDSVCPSVEWVKGQV